MLKQPIYSRRVLLYLIISFSPVYLIDAGEEKNKFPEKLFKLLLLLPCVLYVDCWKGGSRAAERTLKTLSVILFLPIGYIYIFRDFWNMPSGCRPGVRSWFSSSFPPSSLQERKTGFSLFYLYIHPFFPSYSFSNAPGPPMEQPRATGGKKMARGALRLFSSTFFSLYLRRRQRRKKSPNPTLPRPGPPKWRKRRREVVVEEEKRNNLPEARTHV